MFPSLSFLVLLSFLNLSATLFLIKKSHAPLFFIQLHKMIISVTPIQTTSVVIIQVLLYNYTAL